MSKKILIIAPAWVGDMVMAQSLLKLLKQRDPHVILHVAAIPSILPLLTRMPEVSATTVLPFAHGQLDLKGRYTVAKKLRAERFDQAIVLPNSFKSALLLWWAPRDRDIVLRQSGGFGRDSYDRGSDIDR